MRPLRYSINVTLDDCVDHMAAPVHDAALMEDMHRHHADYLSAADTLLFGRVTYQMMEEGWRSPPPQGWSDDEAVFARTIAEADKYVVSTTLREVDWNAQLLTGDLVEAVQALKDAPGDGIMTGGVQLPLALAELGLIDEYQFVVLPRIAGHGPRLFDGLSAAVDLTLVGRDEWASGAVVLTYTPTGRA